MSSDDTVFKGQTFSIHNRTYGTHNGHIVDLRELMSREKSEHFI